MRGVRTRRGKTGSLRYHIVVARLVRLCIMITSSNYLVKSYTRDPSKTSSEMSDPVSGYKIAMWYNSDVVH